MVGVANVAVDPRKDPKNIEHWQEKAVRLAAENERFRNGLAAAIDMLRHRAQIVMPDGEPLDTFLGRLLR